MENQHQPGPIQTSARSNIFYFLYFLTFNTVPVARITLTCFSKANNGTRIIRKLSNTLPKNSLLTIYKSSIRPHLDYCDIIYDQSNNESFCTEIESIQYNSALLGAIKGTSHTKL